MIIACTDDGNGCTVLLRQIINISNSLAEDVVMHIIS